ncbi:MAG: hypothetical protein Q8R26_01030 [bacterium]|nr:hypothetical protein [bacterium]
MEKYTVGQLLKNRVLWKIYFVWFVRRIIPLIIIQVGVVVVAIKLFGQKVFVSRIMAQSVVRVSEVGYWDVFTYLVGAFFKTHAVVQIIIILILGVGALIIRDIVKSILTYRSMHMRG